MFELATTMPSVAICLLHYDERDVLIGELLCRLRRRSSIAIRFIVYTTAVDHRHSVSRMTISCAAEPIVARNLFETNNNDRTTFEQISCFVKRDFNETRRQPYTQVYGR